MASHTSSASSAFAPLQNDTFLRACLRQATDHTPLWLMRQAGRYLPEYRALRATTPDFISFCLNPEKAAEATMQPMRRFGFDAAIVFADILLIPRALGQDVWFEAGEGPRLGELPSLDALEGEIEASTFKLTPVGQRKSQFVHERARQVVAVAGALFHQALFHQAGQHTVHGGLVLLASSGQVGQTPAEPGPRGDHAHDRGRSHSACRNSHIRQSPYPAGSTARHADAPAPLRPRHRRLSRW